MTYLSDVRYTVIKNFFLHQTVIDDWIGNYNSDRASAMVDLIQVIIQCCGCKGTVQADNRAQGIFKYSGRERIDGGQTNSLK